MAMDFPASPNLNDTYTYAGVTYTWNGYGWIGGALGSAAVISDAPADGNDYIRVNNVWRMVKQTLRPASGTTIDVAVPSWATMVEIDGAVFCATGSAIMQMQISMDGTTFLTTSYGVAQPYHTGNPGTFGASPLTGSQTAFSLTNMNDAPTIPVMFQTKMNVARDGVTQQIIHKTYSNVYNTAQQFVTGWATGNIIPAAGLRIAALRFLVNGATFAPTGQIHCRWL